MAMAQQPRQFHPLPVIGYPETYYAKHIQQADAAGDTLAHNAYKVGQYVTLGLDPRQPWEEKVKCFRHTLKHHCVPPVDADGESEAFYAKLRDLACRYASNEALRVARQEHDAYTMRQELGESRDVLVEEAEVFFPTILGHGECPDWCSPGVWKQLCTLRDQWI